jgi:hypothetical protein
MTIKMATITPTAMPQVPAQIGRLGLGQVDRLAVPEIASQYPPDKQVEAVFQLVARVRLVAADGTLSVLDALGEQLSLARVAGNLELLISPCLFRRLSDLDQRLKGIAKASNRILEPPDAPMELRTELIDPRLDRHQVLVECDESSRKGLVNILQAPGHSFQPSGNLPEAFIKLFRHPCRALFKCLPHPEALTLEFISGGDNLLTSLRDLPADVVDEALCLKIVLIGTPRPSYVVTHFRLSPGDPRNAEKSRLARTIAPDNAASGARWLWLADASPLGLQRIVRVAHRSHPAIRARRALGAGKTF